MDLRHKHHALIWIGLLLAVFLGIVAWFFFRNGAPPAPGILPPPVATSTPDAVLVPPKTYTDSGRFYEVRATYPSATPLPEGKSEDALAVMEAFIRSQGREFAANASVGLMSPEEAELAFPGGRKYTLDIDYKTATGPRTVTYTFTIAADTLGAHPNTTFRTFTFDTETGAQLTLGDLFLPDSQYLERLSIRARNELTRTIRERMQTIEINERMLSAGTEASAQNFQWFRVEGTNLVLLFPPYQVAPYALGALEVAIPLAQLGEVLKPAYLP